MTACRHKLGFWLAQLLYGIIFGLLSVQTTKAFAAYKVEIDAPKEINAILKEHLDLVHYKDHDDVSDDQLKFMLDTVNDQVAQLTSTEGYFLPTTKVTVAPGKIKVIHLKVDAHRRTMVSRATLDVKGRVVTEVPGRRGRLQRNWRLPAGQPFRQSDWDAAKEYSLQLLQYKGFPSAKIVQSEARIEPDNNDAQLSVQYDSGPSFTLGPLEISGIKRYPKSIIENVNPLNVGENYDLDRLLYLQRQIQSTGYFGNVIVGIDDDPTHPSLTPVKVQVTEFPSQRVRAGVGYGTDTGAQVQGRYSNYNVFGKGWVFDTQAKIEQRRQFGSLELNMPPDQRGFVNGINTSYERTTLEGADLRSQRIGLRRARALENYDTALTLDYYLDSLQQTDGAVLPPGTFILPGQHQAFVPGFSWTRRDVDDQIFPTEGDIFSVQTGVALKGLMTDQSFFRAYLRYKRYVPVAKHDIMIFRVEGGGVFTKGAGAEVPASLLFRAGGNESVRGYSYLGIGNTQNGTFYPTKYLMTASAEYQHWFNQTWGGAVFYDIGIATDGWVNKEIKVGTGFGVRWHSPVGPINLDLAYGVQDKRIQPHISLGIAF
ncbi:MAG: outer membrane protein assembly factor [Glaciimonas sp.]|nr:outer membrane protein assembly factor [Glaciimonas sp.]